MSDKTNVSAAIYLLIALIGGIGVYNAYSIHKLNAKLENDSLSINTRLEENNPADSKSQSLGTIQPDSDKDLALVSSDELSSANDDELEFDQEAFDRLEAERLKKEKAEIEAKTKLEIEEQRTYAQSLESDASDVEEILNKIEQLKQ